MLLLPHSHEVRVQVAGKQTFRLDPQACLTFQPGVAAQERSLQKPATRQILTL